MKTKQRRYIIEVIVDGVSFKKFSVLAMTEDRAWEKLLVRLNAPRMETTVKYFMADKEVTEL